MSKLDIYKQWNTELFSVRDTISIPHTYTVTPKHLQHSSGMYLDIDEAESKGAKCGHPGCNLTHAQHETALAISCKSKDNDLLHAYLLTIKEQCEKDEYAGFVFVDCTNA